MKNLFNTLVSIFFTLTIISCVENSGMKSSPSESNVKEISVHNEVEGTFDTKNRPTFSSIASSYTTNLMPDTEQISINQITISNKLDCSSENTNLCDELLLFFKNATSFNFIAKEEFAEVYEGKKNVYIIKGNFSGGDRKVNASLLYSVHENYFKGDIIIDTPSEFTSTRDRSISISVKGKK